MAPTLRPRCCASSPATRCRRPDAARAALERVPRRLVRHPGSRRTPVHPGAASRCPTPGAPGWNWPPACFPSGRPLTAQDPRTRRSRRQPVPKAGARHDGGTFQGPPVRRWQGAQRPSLASRYRTESTPSMAVRAVTTAWAPAVDVDQRVRHLPARTIEHIVGVQPRARHLGRYLAEHVGDVGIGDGHPLVGFCRRSGSRGHDAAGRSRPHRDAKLSTAETRQKRAPQHDCRFSELRRAAPRVATIACPEAFAVIALYPTTEPKSTYALLALLPADHGRSCDQFESDQGVPPMIHALLPTTSPATPSR